MSYSGPAPLNPTRHLFKDVSVFSVSNFPYDGSILGTATNFLGNVETAEITVKREKVDITGATDLGHSSRIARWSEGSLSITGYSNITGSIYAAIYAQGGHAILQLTEAASTGDIWELVVTCEEYKKSMGKDATKETITFPIEGIPYYGPAAASPTAMTLE